MTELTPNAAALKAHYQSFLRPGRVLLTGHSHQAWPDVAREGLARSFDDAAQHVDQKWEQAFAVADALREELAERVGGTAGEFALGANTHELVVRFLSGLDLGRRRRLVTTSGEFHSLYRQMRRLGEEGVAVEFVAPEPVDTLAERLAHALTEHTSAVLVSTVLFETATVVPHLELLTERADKLGVEVLLDAYHGAGVLEARPAELHPRAWVVGGGYKYLQWGEGVCFLRVPPHSDHRPVVTGWFADFAHLSSERSGHGLVHYAERPADRFAGSTYDPGSHYRALSVARFFKEQGLTLARLAQGYRHQTSVLLEALGDWPVRTPRDESQRGGFVAVAVSDPEGALRAMEREGVYADARGECVRLGPAPYLDDDELRHGASVLRRVASPSVVLAPGAIV